MTHEDLAREIAASVTEYLRIDTEPGATTYQDLVVERIADVLREAEDARLEAEIHEAQRERLAAIHAGEPVPHEMHVHAREVRCDLDERAVCRRCGVASPTISAPLADGTPTYPPFCCQFFVVMDSAARIADGRPGADSGLRRLLAFAVRELGGTVRVPAAALEHVDPGELEVELDDDTTWLEYPARTRPRRTGGQKT